MTTMPKWGSGDTRKAWWNWYWKGRPGLGRWPTSQDLEARRGDCPDCLLDHEPVPHCPKCTLPWATCFRLRKCLQISGEYLVEISSRFCCGRFVATTQPIDTSTATGKLLLGVLAAVAEFERELIKLDRAFRSVYEH